MPKINSIFIEVIDTMIQVPFLMLLTIKNSGGSVLLFPIGTYTFSGSLALRRVVSLRGESQT